MEYFIIHTFTIMQDLKFSPLVLIGLLITSLSLILNLKDTNKFIKKFKEHKNIEIFINKIYYTSSVLILMFIISILINYIDIKYQFSLQLTIVLGIISIIYSLCIIYLAYTLFTIVFMLKEIVKTSLKDDL
jgi:hypothetical protein